jgi:dTDP-4-dehydrorhamnose reductase
VFLGDKGSYSEESIKDARDLYGVSKGLGEVSGGNNMTVRTSIIGPERQEKGYLIGLCIKKIWFLAIETLLVWSYYIRVG